MWRVLVMPSQLARLGLQREHGIRVEVVPLPFVSVVIRTRVSRGPIEQVRLRVVGPGQPRCAASMQERRAFPCFRQGLSRRRNGPKTPHSFAVLGSVGGKETASSFVSPRCTGNNEILDDKRGRGRAVILAVVRHFHVPEQLAIKTM